MARLLQSFSMVNSPALLFSIDKVGLSDCYGDTTTHPPPKYLNKFLTINDFDLVTIVISTGYFINFPNTKVKSNSKNNFMVTYIQIQL